MFAETLALLYTDVLSAKLNKREGERVAALPVLDPRTPEEILDYDERGLPR